MKSQLDLMLGLLAFGLITQAARAQTTPTSVASNSVVSNSVASNSVASKPVASAVVDSDPILLDQNPPAKTALIKKAPKRALPPKTISFSGYDWRVRNSVNLDAPGPNNWDQNGVWVDDKGYLHLKLARVNGEWQCSEIYLTQKLGFGRYRFDIEGPVDKLDPNVVFGLFHYPSHDMGKDGTNEIDIEFSQWGTHSGQACNYTVWPVQAKQFHHNHHAFHFLLDDNKTTEQYTWTSTSIRFQSFQGFGDNEEHQFSDWVFNPPNPLTLIAQHPMMVCINLWCFKGRPPTDGKPVEVIVRSFKFTPLP